MSREKKEIKRFVIVGFPGIEFSVFSTDLNPDPFSFGVLRPFGNLYSRSLKFPLFTDFGPKLGTLVFEN